METPIDPDTRVAAVLAQQAETDRQAERGTSTNWDPDRGHRYQQQCWSAQGLGCAAECGWGGHSPDASRGGWLE